MNSPVGLPDPIQTRFMAFVPLAALAALAGTTTALYQSAQVNRDKPRTFATITQPSKPQPSKPSPPTQISMAKPKTIVLGSSSYVGNGSAGKNRSKRRTSNRVVSAPASRGTNYMNTPPRLVGNGHKLTISHCEPFIAVNMTAAGALAYATSPIIPASFNYLTGIANNFGKWTWKRLVLHYVPSCPTTADGEVALGTYYDRQDAVAATFVQVTQMQGGVSTPPWGGGPFTGSGAVRVDIDCSRFDKPRYSFIGTTPFNALTTSDQNNYCPVSMARATQGNTAGGAIMGRVWAEYTVELIDPIPSGINP